MPRDQRPPVRAHPRQSEAQLHRDAALMRIARTRGAVIGAAAALTAAIAAYVSANAPGSHARRLRSPPPPGRQPPHHASQEHPEAATARNRRPARSDPGRISTAGQLRATPAARAARATPAGSSGSSGTSGASGGGNSGNSGVAQNSGVPSPAAGQQRPGRLGRIVSAAAPATSRLTAFAGTAIVGTSEPERLEAAEEAVTEVVDAFDLACSRFRVDSELTALNAAAPASPVASVHFSSMP